MAALPPDRSGNYDVQIDVDTGRIYVALDAVIAALHYYDEDGLSYEEAAGEHPADTIRRRFADSDDRGQSATTP